MFRDEHGIVLEKSVSMSNSLAAAIPSIVAQVWQAEFGAQAYADGRTFEACGCDSIAMLSVVLGLEKATGLRMPMEAFHVGLGPADILAIVQGAARPAVREVGQIFFVPPIGGDTPEMAAFRAACEPVMPMKAVALPTALFDDPALQMADVLRVLIDAVLVQAGPGPIGLVGYSRGGRLAALMALELLALGRAVPFVAMLDSSGAMDPQDIDPRTRPNQGLRDAVWAGERAWRRRRWSGLASWSNEWAARLTAWGLMRLPVGPAVRAARMVAPAFSAPGQVRFAIDRAAHRLDRLMAAWYAQSPLPPGALAMPVILLRAATQGRPRGDDLGWGPTCQHLTVIEVKGDHESMLYEHGTPTAKALLSAVARLAVRTDGTTTFPEREPRSAFTALTSGRTLAEIPRRHLDT